MHKEVRRKIDRMQFEQKLADLQEYGRYPDRFRQLLITCYRASSTVEGLKESYEKYLSVCDTDVEKGLVKNCIDLCEERLEYFRELKAKRTQSLNGIW
jgi:hypothetical protein